MNYFLLLGFRPPRGIPTNDEIKEAVRQKKNEWSRNQNNPKKRNQAEENLRLIPEMEEKLLKESSKKEAWKQAQSEYQEKRSKLIEALKIDNNEKIASKFLEKLVHDFEGYFTREEIEKEYAELKKQGREGSISDEMKKLIEETEKLLKSLSKEGFLYQYINAESSWPISKLQQKIKEKENYIRTKGDKKNSDGDELNLCMKAKQVFRSKDTQKQYDKYLEIKKYPDLADDIDSYALVNSEKGKEGIDPRAFLKIYEKYRSRFSRKKLLKYIEEYCNFKNYQLDHTIFLTNDGGNTNNTNNTNSEPNQENEDDDEYKEEEFNDDVNYRQWISMVNQLDGYEFERYCAYILKGNGYKKVEVTQGSQDNGVDIIAVKGKIKYAVQCKRWNQSSVGNDVVERIEGSKGIYSCHKGMVITNSTFTAAAYKSANELDVRLIDGYRLFRMIPAKRGSRSGKIKKCIYAAFLLLLILIFYKSCNNSIGTTDSSNKTETIKTNAETIKTDDEANKAPAVVDQKRLSKDDIRVTLSKYYGHERNGCWMKNISNVEYCFKIKNANITDTSSGQKAFVAVQGVEVEKNVVSTLKNFVFNKEIHDFFTLQNEGDSVRITAKGSYENHHKLKKISFVKMGNDLYGWGYEYKDDNSNAEKVFVSLFLPNKDEIIKVADVELLYNKRENSNVDEIAEDSSSLSVSYGFDSSEVDALHYPIVTTLKGHLNNKDYTGRKYLWVFDESENQYIKPDGWPFR